MSAGLLLMTHGDIGKAMLETACDLVGARPYRAHYMSVYPHDSPELLLSQATALCHEVATAGNVLILTDIFGATPCNLATSLRMPDMNLRVVAGVNLPMMIRLLNYPDLTLDELVDKAVGGGSEGVFACARRDETGD